VSFSRVASLQSPVARFGPSGVILSEAKDLSED
jgi:hypothetical protein